MSPTSRDPFSRAFLAVVAALLLLIIPAAAGCGGAEEEGGTAATTTAAATTTVAATTTAAITTTEPTTTTTEAPDLFAMGIAIAPDTGDAIQVPVLAAAERVAAEYPADVTIAGSDDPVADLRELAAAADLVVLVGFGFEEPLTEVAADYPDVVFVYLDVTVDAPNVVSAQFALNEAAFLVGVAAALTTQTGQVAFLGGVATPGVTMLEAGFAAGVAAADPEVTVATEYLGGSGDWSAFSDPARARLVALDLYGAGVDVIFHGAAGSGAGVFTAAVETRAAGSDVWAIGVDLDEADGADADVASVILTSAIRDYEAAVWWVAAEFAAGRLTGGDMDLGVAEGAVRYTTTGGWLDAIAADLDAFAAQIADGSIEVPDQL